MWATLRSAFTPILLTRVAVHDVPDLKWVEFRAEPQGYLADGTPWLLALGVLDRVIGCSWGDYLKLVRRKKVVGGEERDGRLAQLIPVEIDLADVRPLPTWSIRVLSVR